jgi:hypothetical protein
MASIMEKNNQKIDMYMHEHGVKLNESITNQCI